MSRAVAPSSGADVRGGSAARAVVLRADALSKRFGGLDAVRDLSFEVAAGEIFAIIGPNGAGKTTTLNMVSGLLEPTSGRLELGGHDVTDRTSAERCHAGLGRAFQVVQPFPEMTVEENVMVGALFGSPGRAGREALELARSALADTGLEPLRGVPAEDLTLLQEKRLEIARALATDPTVLLLDEVMAGLRPAEARQAVELIRRVRERGVSVVFIEHVMPVVRDLADRVLVMDYGRPIAEGSYAEVTADPRVIEAYLGRDDEDGDKSGNEHGNENANEDANERGNEHGDAADGTAREGTP